MYKGATYGWPDPSVNQAVKFLSMIIGIFFTHLTRDFCIPCPLRRFVAASQICHKSCQDSGPFIIYDPHLFLPSAGIGCHLLNRFNC
jgi:hypothetical protein